jgi:hypothetical protein
MGILGGLIGIVVLVVLLWVWYQVHDGWGGPPDTGSPNFP